VNVANQKLFVLIWVWLALMGLLTCLGLLYRAASLFSLSARMWQVCWLTCGLSEEDVAMLGKKYELSFSFLVYNKSETVGENFRRESFSLRLRNVAIS
jgi:hypothetical protein